jgi:hypothetical protein
MNQGGYLACLIVYVILHFVANMLLSILGLCVESKEKKAEIHPMTGTLGICGVYTLIFCTFLFLSCWGGVRGILRHTLLLNVLLYDNSALFNK